MRPGPSIHDVGAVVRELVVVRRVPVVVVVVPGGAASSVGDAIADALAGAELDIARVTAQRTGPVGSAPTVDAGSTATLVTEAQWLAEPVLEQLRAAGGSLIVVHRPVELDGSLAILHADSYEHGALVRLGPTTFAELTAEGWDAATTEQALAATGGRADLLVSWESDGALDGDITIRLSLLDDACRRGVELLAFGATSGDLADLLGLDPESSDLVLQAIESEGLSHDGVVPPGVVAAVRRAATPGRRARVVELLLERGGSGTTIGLAEALADVGDRSSAAGLLYSTAARQLVGVDQHRAEQLLVLAGSCGVETVIIGPIAAELALVRGDPAEAIRQLGNPGGDPDAHLLAASAWFALGDAAATADALAASALPELSRWAELAAGQVPSASVDDHGRADRDPTAAAIADAIDAWWAGDRDLALDLTSRALVRAATSSQDTWPATPHEIAGVLTSRLGDIGRAAHIAEAAAVDRAGGPRHRRGELLSGAWFSARLGRLDDAAAVIDELGETMLSPRERWIRAAVNCAIAIRDSEPGGLEAAAAGASVALAGRTADLFDLELLGEIAATLARVGASTVDDVLRSQDVLVERLGRPLHLDFDLAWIRLCATLATDDAESLANAARLVMDHVDPPPHQEAVVAVARAVVGCLDGDVDADAVVVLAGRLAALGRVHEAARLCGTAAVHATDEATTRRLLKQSRDWRARRARVKEVRGVDRTVIRLSDQEVRVARMVDDGLTYKAIGAELFISPKTVEHHVAHIRSKLGAGSRAELLAAIRSYLASEVASNPS